MIRFFMRKHEINGNVICLEGENAKHAKVLRLQQGEEVLLCDGEGVEYLCTVRNTDQFELEIHDKRLTSSEAAIKASLYIAFPKSDKLEHVIQKATELGAAEINVFPAARCVSRPDDKSLQKKLERWEKIALSAAEQSGRGLIPQIYILNSYANALEKAALADRALLFYEHEQAKTLHMALKEKAYQTVSLMTGPEGGLEPWEVEKAREQGLQVCTLGKRILRCETAPLCALSAVMYDAGEF